METNLFKSINLIRCVSGKNRYLFRYAAMVIMLLMLGVSDAWAGGSAKKDDPEHTSNGAYMSAKTNSNAEGLVYISTSSSANPGVSDYYAYAPIGTKNGTTNTKDIEAVKCHVLSGSMEGPHKTYYWAKPMRGYRFDKWTGMLIKSSRSNYNPINTIETTNGYTDVANWDGVKDIVYASAGLTQCTYTRVTANFAKLGTSMVTYVRPVGSSYTVSYSYLEPEEITRTYEWTDQDVKNSNSYTDYRFKQTDVSYSVSNTDDRDKEEKFYDGEKVRLVTTVTNFEGWYANNALLSTNKDYTYTIPTSPNAPETPQTIRIEARVKSVTIGTATGDLGPTLEAFSADGLESADFAVTVPVTTLGTWVASDFNVAFAEQTSPARGDISKGKVTYSAGTLTIPFTFNPSSFGNTNVQVTVSPTAGAAYGNTVQFNILASANQLTNFEACIIENSVQISQGSLADMVAQANTMDSKPTIQLAKDVTINSPVSLQKSMTFDLNDKTLTSTGASAFSIAAQGVDVQIVDNGFSQLGTIAVSSSQSGNVSVVTFTQKAKLTMQGGTLSATNTGSGSAYGINVTQGSTFYMTNGQLTVTGVSEAQGVHVATASDYATLNGGSITVTAPAQVYGVWSAGQSNVTGATIAAETTTGANAYGIYVNGGVSTLTANTVTATAKTTGAYAAYVNAGRLNGNGGSFAATAVTSGVYGVHIQSGATAVVQQNAVVTAEATDANGTSVFGVNNLGTISLTNVSVTATSPTTAATAVNTATSATSTTIDGGTYRATATGGTAYGLHHQHGLISIDGGTFRGVGDGNTVYGIRAIENATIANATITGETFSTGNSAYGILGEGTGKTITLTNCAITGRSNASKAYAIYADANITATNCTLTATTLGSSEAYGVYAKSGTNSLNHCNAIVSAQSVQAYGVYHKAGSLSVEGGEYEVTISQVDAGESKMYGIYNESGITTEVQGAEFDVRTTSSYSQKVYGAYINGSLISSNSTYAVRAQTSVYGIYGAEASNLTLSGNTIGTTVSDGTISYGVYAMKNFSISGDEVRAVGNKTNVYALFFDKTNSVGTVTGGKFYAMGDGTTAFGSINGDATVGNVQLIGGVYSSKVNLERYAATGYQVFNIEDTDPDFAAGYRYVLATSNPSPYVCKIVGGNRYATLEAALQYTKDNDGTYTIVMTQPYTLPAGDYELPQKVTLLIPYYAEQSEIIGAEPERIVVASVLSEHLCLRMATGANLNVNGKIEVSGEMYCSKSGRTSYNASPYARIHMEANSLIQLNSGARLYAWGYITGAGEITVKSDAEVHEMFQIEDMKSMPDMAQKYTDLGDPNDYKFFPLNRYFIQNIEVPTKYYYNARLITAMSIYHGSKLYGDLGIKLIGLKSDKALFAVTSTDENAWVRKSYDAAHDYQVWEVNSSVELGSLQLDLGNFELGPFTYPIKFNSAQYILPLTSNMKVHVKDGNFSITQDAQVLPGVQIEVNKTATLTINDGINVYVFDKDQWPWPSQYTVDFSPGWANGTKPSRSVDDAALNIHGKIDVQGYLYTSNKGTETSKTDGANIYSTNADAGTVEYNKDVPSAQTTVTLMTSTTATKVVTMDPAKLKNGSGVTPAYTETSGTSSGRAFMYYENKWQDSYTNGCFQILGSTVYAKPSGYVALKKSQPDANSKLTGVEETNHTYLTADDKILILMDECQWWEVVATSDPTVFECKKSGYEGFYFYNTSTKKWELKTVNVKFYKNETGNEVLKTIVTNYNGIPDQSVIATNPSKGTTAEYTYSFYGWTSSETGDTIKWTDQLEVATKDMSYRPAFTETKRNYTITLVNANNGANVPLEVPYGEKPSYEPIKDADAQYTYSFKDWTKGSAHYATCNDMPTVTGTATYTANWNSVVNEYNITWMNGETVLEVDENQPYGTVTVYNGETPTKDADNNYAYEFSGWHNSLTNAPRANNETVTGAIIYTAQYNTTPRYAVTFNNYDGVQLDRIVYTQGETPAYAGVPTHKRDDNGYFKFIGWKNSNGMDYAANVTLPAVTKKETYTAQYEYVTDLFTITLKNVHGNGESDEWSGKFGDGSIPFYDPDGDDMPDTPTKAGNAQYSYPFNGWSLTSGGVKLSSLPVVDGEATYWALFTQEVNKYTVEVVANNNAWGSVSETSVSEVPYNTSVTTSENTLTVNGTTITATPAADDEQYMYRFEGWESVPSKVTGATEIQAVFKAYVATVEAGGNTTYHTTIADAISTANTLTNNPTVKMYRNGSTTSEIEISKTMTIDLNGKTISSTLASATGVFKINASGKTVTITDSGTGGKIDHTADYAGYLYGINLVAGTLNVTGGTIYAENTKNTASSSSYRAIGIYYASGNTQAASVTMSNGTVEAKRKQTYAYAICLYTANCGLTLTGGEVIASGTGKIRGIYTQGTATLSNAIVSATASGTEDCYAVFSDKTGLYTINSGTYTATGAGTEVYPISVTKATTSAGGSITINGGRFSGKNQEVYVSNGTATLKGGYYVHNTDLAVKCAENYHVFELTEAEKAELGSDDYNYKVAKAYTLNWTTDGDALTGTYSTGVIEVDAPIAAPNTPTKTGYTFAEWSPEFTGTMPAASTTYTATWTPNTNTPYTVEHYKQKLDGSYAATPDETDNLTGTTATNVTPDRKSYEGFTSPAGQEVSILADGSRVVVYKYTRISYALSWTSDGDDLTGTFTTGDTKYGASITAPNTPTKTGYTFAGWDNGTEVVMTPATQMPASALAYTATWTPNTNTPYVVKHFKQALDGSYAATPDDIDNEIGTTATNVTPAVRDYTGFTAPPTQTEAIAADGSLVITYYYTRNSNLLTWNLGGGKVTTAGTAAAVDETSPSGEVKYEALITAPEVEREGYNFISWNAEVAETMPAAAATYTAIWAKIVGDIEVGGDNVEKTKTIDENTEATTTVVHADAVLTVEEGNTLTTNDLVLEASSSSSGQISASGQIAGAERVTAIDNVYFDLILNTDLRHWRAFTVPFEIDLKQHPILADGVSMPLGVQYDIVYYDGSIRAEQGKVPACWRYVEDDANWILTPGKAYMIVFGRHVDVVRFTKKNEVSIVSTGTVSVEENVSMTGNAVDGGWNGIGNPTTYHALISAGVTECQVHNGEAIGSDGYTAYDMGGKFVVGKAVFVQVGANPSVVVEQAGPAVPIIAEKSGAPRRSRAEIIAQRYDVQIAPADGDMADRIYLMTEEGKEDEYVILKDLAKAGISSVRAQMWIDRYGEKLCKNTTALINGKASYPLSIYAPAAGEYEISVNAGPADSEIYLTLDGRVIWNLSYSGYMANLEKGTTGRYGLRVVSSRVPTGLEDATIENGETIRKVMIEDKVYIIRNGEMYTVTGQLVK